MEIDPMQLAELARAVITYSAPLIAGGALAKVGEDTTDHATALVRRLWQRVQQQVQGNRQAEAALTLYEAQPTNEALHPLVAEQIIARFQGQAAATAELADLLRQLQAAQGAPQAVQQRTLTIRDQAQVGTVVQSDVGGNLTIGPTVFGSRAPAAPPASPTPAPTAPSSDLPATLSADGVHFSYGHALLIGVGQYARWGLSVPTTATDAERLAAVLTDPHAAAYPHAQVALLRNGAATRAGILAALDTLAAQVQQAPRPTVALFFAGHGINKDGAFFLLPYDYAPGDLAGSAIDAATFKAKVDAIAAHAQKLLVLLNCCHSGGVGDDVLSDTGTVPPTDSPPPGFYAPLAEGSGRVVISSSRPAERSGARSSNNSRLTVFGAQLLAAVQGSAPGQGPAVGVFELFTALSTQVPPDARTITDPFTDAPLQQHPLIYTREVDQNFAITLRPTEQRQARTLESALLDAVQQVAAVEVKLAAYASEAAAPPELVAARDRLLRQVAALA